MVWCQEEPRNMGTWFFVDVFLQWMLNQIAAKYRTMRYAGRPAAASTAVGQMSKHLAQLKQFLEEAFGLKMDVMPESGPSNHRRCNCRNLVNTVITASRMMT